MFPSHDNVIYFMSVHPVQATYSLYEYTVKSQGIEVRIHVRFKSMKIENHQKNNQRAFQSRGALYMELVVRGEELFTWNWW